MGRVRRALRALVAIAVLVVGLLVGVAVLSQTAWFRERIRRLAIRQADAALEGTLTIGALDGDFLNGVTLHDVTVTQGTDPVVKVGRVQLEYGLGDLLSAGRVVRRITIDHPDITAVRTPAGWNVAHLLKPRPPAEPGKPLPTFALPDIRVIDGTVTVREVGVPQTTAIPRRIEGLAFEGGVASSPRQLAIDIRRLTFRAGQPDVDLRSVAGRIVSVPDGWRFQALDVRTSESSLTVDGALTRSAPGAPWSFDLDVAGQPVSLPEIGRFFPAATFPLHPRVRASLDGPLDALRMDFAITESEAGRAAGVLTLDATGPSRGLEGRVSTEDVTLVPILGPDSASEGRITGTATVALRFPSAREGFPVDGTFAFEGPRAGAYGYDAANVRVRGVLDGRTVRLDGSANGYGGRATVKGAIARPGRGQRELTLDLAGQVAGFDLRRLPARLHVPALETNLTGSYVVRGALSALEAESTLTAGTVEGAALTDGTTGRFARTARGFTFTASGSATDIDVPRLGEALGVAGMTDDRLAGRLNGSFDVTGEQRGGSEGLSLHASGALADSTSLGGRLPAMRYDVTLDGSRVDVTADGRVEGLPLDALTGKPAMTGRLSGQVRAHVVLPDVARVALETMDVTATTTLDASTLLNVPFEQVTMDVSLAGGLASVRRFDGRGAGFTLTASGALGLAQDAVSDLRYRLEASSLVEPAKVLDLPVTGAATAEGRLSGSAAAPLVEGTVAGDQVAYGDSVVAGTLTAQYAVRVPDWDPTRLAADVSVDGEQVQVAGQVLTSVDGTIAYADRIVRFDAKGTDAARALEARGALQLDDAQQRLTLEHAQVSRSGVTWQLAPESAARAVITPRQVTVAELHARNGEQRVDMEGTVGIEADAESSLRVEASGVDVGDVLTLAAQEVDVDGRLDVSATVGGTRERPLVDGQIDVTQGRVRSVDIERLGGRVTFDGTLAIVDLELIKDANSRITAKGIVPRTLLDARSDTHVQATPADKLDVAILSTPIDLALAEGLSTYVTGLGGQAQVDVRLTGSGHEPHVEGALFLMDGAFAVPLTGVRYKNLDAVLTFQQERVVISELGVETDNGDLLTVKGELGLSRAQARSVSLQMQGRDFRVLDNDYGLLDLDVDLTVSGTLLAPVVEGKVAVSDGRLELDEIVPQVVDTAYATKAEYQGIPTERLRGAIVPELLDAEDHPLPLAPGLNTFTLNAPPPVASADPGGAAASTAAEPPPSVVAQTALNVQVRIPDNLVVRGQRIEVARSSVGDLNATLGGDFRVAKTAGKPAVLLGAISTVRGTYAYQGRRFDLVRDGQILFRGDEDVDPRLDISAERVIQGVEARVRIQGSARKPELSLSSNPPLDEGDILALIVFNQPLNQLGTGQQNSVAQRAGGIAAGFVVSPLAEALGSTLDLDQFEVETTDPSGRVNPAIVIGQQVTQDLFLRFRQQFGNQQVSQFLLEYRLANFLRLQGNAAEGDGLTAGNRSLTQRIEQYGVDLVFYFTF